MILRLKHETEKCIHLMNTHIMMMPPKMSDELRFPVKSLLAKFTVVWTILCEKIKSK